MLYLASKEWVIPSKPKPGRKPKKDVATEDTGEVCSTIQVFLLVTSR